jgi:hypothetical protein
MAQIIFEVEKEREITNLALGTGVIELYNFEITFW